MTNTGYEFNYLTAEEMIQLFDEFEVLSSCIKNT